ncbi:MAG: O-antigen ligase family protein [Pseudonocardiales bacterium]
MIRSAPVNRADSVTLASCYALVVTVLPGGLVFKGISFALTPAMLIGFGMGALWCCAQLVTTLGAAKGRNPVRTALFLYAAAHLATYGYVTYGYLPPDELNATDRTLLTLLAVIAVGIAVCDGVRTTARLDRLLKVVVVGCALMAVVGLIQFFVKIDLAQYLVLPGLKPANELSRLLERSIFTRPAGTTAHPIEFGVVCAVAIPLAMHYAFRALDTGRPQKHWWLCLALLGVGAMVSLSRSAIIGLSIALIVLIPAMPKGRRLRVVLACGAFLVAMRLVVPGLVGTLVSLFTGISNDPSIDSRQIAIGRAQEEITNHPLLGRGVGTYFPEKYGFLDNQYLGTIVQNGYIGLAALLGLFIVGMYAAVRARAGSRDPDVRSLSRALLASIAVVATTSATFDLLGFGTVTGLMFLLLGAAGALLRSVRTTAANPPTLAARILARLRGPVVQRGPG